MVAVKRLSPRDIERDVRALDSTADVPDDPLDVRVEWREADPEGMGFDAEDERLHYDLWAAQRTALDRLRSRAAVLTPPEQGPTADRTHPLILLCEQTHTATGH